MKVSSAACAALGAVLALILTASSARSDDPVTSAVRFNREIVRIFDRKCVSCHTPDAIAMSLSTYRDVRPWARAIREEIVEQRMPPTAAVRGYGRLKDDIALTPRELTTILTWLDGGVPRGDEADLPPPPKGERIQQPDHEVAVPPQEVAGAGEDLVRHVTVETGLSEDRWVRSVQFRPGDRRLLRAAFISIVRDDQPPVWAGSWTPWQREASAEPPAAFFIPRGARLAIELHYRGQDAPARDSSTVALFVAPPGRWRELTSVALTPKSSKTASGEWLGKAETTLPRGARVWGVRLAAPLDPPSLEVTARQPDGTVQVLLWTPGGHAKWPMPFIFADPAELPAGTVLSVTTAGTQAQSAVRTILTLQNVN